MLRPFARGLYELRAMIRETSVLSSVNYGLNDLLYPDFVQPLIVGFNHSDTGMIVPGGNYCNKKCYYFYNHNYNKILK